jgi:DNA repair protein RecN (Recombination protein N)
MLVSLRLKNFAVVEEAEVGFGPGLTVLTGETGAGKSILVDALGLVLGGRAEVEVVRAGADEASVEALFETSAGLQARLAELGLPDDGPQVMVRRTVPRVGRGKVHVNGAPVTVGLVQRLMKGLLDIAGQHEHMALFDSGAHLGLVDTFGALGGAGGPLEAYRAAWARLREAGQQLEALGGDEAQVAARLDYLAFQRREIDQVDPKPGEDAALELEKRRLGSAERLRTLLGGAEASLGGAEGSALERVGRALHELVEAERLDAGLAPLRAAVASAQVELDDAARTLRRSLDALDADPRRLEAVDERLDAIRRLCRKHAAPVEGVLARRHALDAEIEQLTHRAERRAELEQLRAGLEREAGGLAQALTGARARAGTLLAEAVREGLGRLAMARAHFEVEVAPAALGPSGADRVQLLFCANPGEAPRPLDKVASGGEASRVLLAIKAALAGGDACLSSIFDEADAGIGGAVADVVGRLLKDISRHRQVLCVTHLPQVAAHADAHLVLEKGVARGRTRAVVRSLEADEDRQRELARMLSGVEVSAEALGAAQALLRSASSLPARARRARPRVDGHAGRAGAA